MTTDDTKMPFKVHEGYIYKNDKTGFDYMVLYVARAAWDGEQSLVVYRLNDTTLLTTVWVRSLTEFLEKFSPIQEQEK